MSATLVARDAADKRITIKMTSTTANTTKISIRVGTFGSETKSRLVYSKMMENLRAAAPAAQTPVAAQPAQTPPAPPAAQEPAQSPASPPASQQPAPTPPAPATPPAQGTPTPGQ